MPRKSSELTILVQSRSLLQMDASIQMVSKAHLWNRHSFVPPLLWSSLGQTLTIADLWILTPSLWRSESSVGNRNRPFEFRSLHQFVMTQCLCASALFSFSAHFKGMATADIFASSWMWANVFGALIPFSTSATGANQSPNFPVPWASAKKRCNQPNLLLGFLKTAHTSPVCHWF